MEKILISTTVFPTAELIAHCGSCGVEIKRLPYQGYFDCDRQRSKIKKIASCPSCKCSFRKESSSSTANMPKWERDEKGRMFAKCKNGDFMVWKDGRIWKWRWRVYGGLYANHLGRSSTKAGAMRACTCHREWINRGKEE